MLYYIDKSSGSGAHCESDKNVNFPKSGPNVRNGEYVELKTAGDKIFIIKFMNQGYGLQIQELTFVLKRDPKWKCKELIVSGKQSCSTVLICFSIMVCQFRTLLSPNL